MSKSIHKAKVIHVNSYKLPNVELLLQLGTGTKYRVGLRRYSGYRFAIGRVIGVTFDENRHSIGEIVIDKRDGTDYLFPLYSERIRSKK